MTCTVCRHPERGEVDRLLAQGEPERTIGARFGLSKPAVHRHKVHIREQIQAHEAGANQHALEVHVERQQTAQMVVRQVVDELREMADQCREARTGHQYLKVADRIIRAAEALGKLTGEANNSLAQLLLSLGVQNEAELRQALDLWKSSRAEVSPEEGRGDAIEVLRMLWHGHPEWASEDFARLKREAFGVAGFRSQG